jgi:hypothetical protein
MNMGKKTREEQSCDFEREGWKFERRLMLELIDSSQNLVESSLSSYKTGMMQDLEQVSEILDKMVSGVGEVADAADTLLSAVTAQKGHLDSIAAGQTSIDKNSQSGVEAMEEFSLSIENLGELSLLLKAMIADNHDIAEQLHLLSINGSIEAARAGTVVGAPFKVVAQEISNLSTKAGEIISQQEDSVNHIGEVIESLTSGNKKIVDRIKSNGATIAEAAASIQNINNEMGQIASGAEELSAISHQFSAAISQMQQAVERLQENANRFFLSLQNEFDFNKTVTSIFTKLITRPEETTNMEEMAKWIIDTIYNHFLDEQGNHTLALARLFVSLPEEKLDSTAAQATKNKQSASGRYLCLMATKGSEEAWNERARSVHHKAIPLPRSQQELEIMPMLAEMFRNMKVNYQRIISPVINDDLSAASLTDGYMLVEETVGSRFIPAQDDFIKPYGIASELGYGGILPSGAIFTCFLFSKSPISHHMADGLRLLSSAIQQALLPFDLKGLYWEEHGVVPELVTTAAVTEAIG